MHTEKGPKKEKVRTATELRRERAKLPVTHAGPGFDDKHQLFIAKLKGGELWALNHLATTDKGTITPVFEMWPPSIPRPAKPQLGKKQLPAKSPKTLAKHSEDLMQMVHDEWLSLPFFLDTQYVPKGGSPTAEAAKTIFNAARSLGLPATPVTHLYFTPSFQAEIADVIAKDQRGVMVRLRIEDFTNPSLLPSYLEALRTVLKVNMSEVDILIDLKHRTSQAEVSALGTSCLQALPDISKWRTISLGSGCFPSTITEWKAGQWIALGRSDWLGWNDVRNSRRSAGLRAPTYADYGVRCGGAPLGAARRPDPNIRYTVAKQVLTRKGSKEDGQIKVICADLLTKPEFSGVDFSRGDEEIAQKAVAQGSPNNGQAGQWIQWSTNHHLTLTSEQIRSLA